MELDYREVFFQICTLGFDYIRLCSYWHEIEPVENQFDFTHLDWLLEQSHQHGIKIVLTVGMKAPRWAEFHFPDWIRDRHNTSGSPYPIDRDAELSDRTLHFTETVVQHTRHAPNLHYWQVENEPFARLEITKGRFLSEAFVQREVALVRSLALPNQKILLTNAITLPAAQFATDDRAVQTSLQLADAVGINVYSKVPIGHSRFYVEPFPPYWHKLKTWQQSLIANGKEAWIAEAQAEPWEPNELVAMKKTDYSSANPQRAAKLVGKLSAIGFDPILLWGCEYWYWHRQQGRHQWWEMVERLGHR